MANTIYIINGPNLNLLGQREPEIYGRNTLADVEALCRASAEHHGFAIAFRQSNHEGDIVDWLQEARQQAAAVVINPGAFTQVPARRRIGRAWLEQRGSSGGGPLSPAAGWEAGGPVLGGRTPRRI